jgi:hypothetical protein
VEPVVSEGPTAPEVARTVVRVLTGAAPAGGPEPFEEPDDDDV